MSHILASVLHWGRGEWVQWGLQNTLWGNEWTGILLKQQQQKLIVYIVGQLSNMWHRWYTLSLWLNRTTWECYDDFSHHFHLFSFAGGPKCPFLQRLLGDPKGIATSMGLQLTISSQLARQPQPEIRTKALLSLAQRLSLESWSKHVVCFKSHTSLLFCFLVYEMVHKVCNDDHFTPATNTIWVT